MKKRVIAFALSLTLIFSSLSVIVPFGAFATAENNGEIIAASDVPLRLYYDEEASHGVSEGYDDVDTYFGSGASLIEAHPNDDWERWSIPLGNGYFGANVFGRTETERIQLTEKTLANPYRITNGSTYTDGLNNFSETYIDFGHTNSAVTGYSRELDLKNAVSTVKYTYGGVEYTREYFTSYPDKAMVIKLDANSEGSVSFTLRPTVPYEQEYMNSEGDRGGKTGSVTSSVENGVGSIVLSGTLEYFDIDFVGLYTVVTDGGNISATTCTNADGDTDGTITVSGANSAYIVINMGTDYELSSETFTASSTSKPTFSTDLDDAMAKVEGYKAATMAQTADKSYDDAYASLKSRHIADYSELFGRVSLDLNCQQSDFELTTDELLENYKNGSGSTYLEALYFQYGRYLLIASSREGALPANLQGAWNRYNHAPWSAGYWHNINVQMNYWPAFSTNLAETFDAYVDYNDAYMEQAEIGATSLVKNYNLDALGTDGGNGWSIATGGYVSDVNASTSIGNLGFTTQMFWEYYEYTKDETILREVVYPVLVSAARFITKMVKEDADGNYIAIYTDSPEQYVNGEWYYTDKGTAYAQSFAYQNNYNTLLAAKELGIDFEDESGEDYEILQTIIEQLDKYDPIRVGLSGQVKEFFEEEYYGDMGEYTHRHISQLVGLYPGNVINGTTPAWMDAAEYTLTERGDNATGWGVAHRLTLWARVQNGERAHDLLNQLLSVNTATNLWDLHPPFQIDGNLGGTAGISEMLLQSHAGYIEPLAAIPAAWDSGSYTGLVARGNFEVAAKWADGIATCFNIYSTKGGEVSVKYAGIEDAVVTTADGAAVSYTVSGDDTITFDTEKGETYIITGFEKKIKPSAVTDLTAESEFLGETQLTWTGVDGATAYNVYVARENESAYTKLATTVYETYVYEPEDFENDRLTFAVTAISIDGTESDRVLVYCNPVDTSATVNKVSANVVDGALQVVTDANEYAKTYKLYMREVSVDPWVLVSESEYPIIIYEDYSSTLQYGVSVESYYGGESEVVKITSYNTDVDQLDYDASNLLLGKEFVPSSDCTTNYAGTAYSFATLTDGLAVDYTNVHSGRYASKSGSTMPVAATVELGGYFNLTELKFYDFDGDNSGSTAVHMGNSLKVEALTENGWVTVAEYSSNEEIAALRADSSAARAERYLSVDMGGYTACQIRFTIEGYATDSVSIWEIECVGYEAVGANDSDRTYTSDVFTGLQFEATENAGSIWTGSYANLTDDVSNSDSSRLGTLSGAKAEGVLDFDGKIAELCDFTVVYAIYSANAKRCGKNIIIEVYYASKWTEVLNHTHSEAVMSETFDLGGVKAEKIKFTIEEKYNDGTTVGDTIVVYEMGCSGYLTSTDKVAAADVFTGLQFEATENAGDIWSGSYANLTDDVDNLDSSRLGTKSGAKAEGVLDFDGKVAELHELAVVYAVYSVHAKRCGKNIIIEVYYAGKWTEVLNHTHSEAVMSETFDLGGVKAEKIKFTIEEIYNDGTTVGDTIVVYEMSCTGYLTPTDKVAAADVFTGLQFEATENAGSIWTGSYANLTDDVDNLDSSRLGTQGGAKAEGVLDFDGKVSELHELAVVYAVSSANAKRCGKNLIISVYNDGEWTVVLNHTHTEAVMSETFDLGGVVAEKIKFTIEEKYNDGTTVGDTIVVYEMSCAGYLMESEEDLKSNVLLGTSNEQITVSGASTHSAFTDKEYQLFDGDLGTRHAVSDVSPYAYSIEVDLNATYPLYTLLIYPFANSSEASRSDNTSVEVYIDGIWFTVASGVVVEPTPGTPTGISLGGIKASKLRINFANTTWSACASIYEITCTTGVISATDRAGLLDAYKELENLDVSGTFGLEEVKSERLRELRLLLSDTAADQTAVDGYIATVNSAFEKLAAGAPVTDEYGDFTSYNLSLEGDIGFNFYGALADGITETFADAFVYVEYADGQTEKLSVADMEQRSDGRYVVRLNMAAAEMSDKVKMRLILDGENCGEYIEQSVKDYAANILADSSYESAYPGINNLITSMLNYGAYAQTYFGHNTDDLANSEVDGTLGDVTDSSSPTMTGEATGLTMSSWTLSLESVVGAKVYFKLADGYDVNSYTASLTTPDGEAIPLDIEDMGTRYRVVIEDIPSGYLDDVYTIVFKNVTDGTSVEVGLSATCYVSRILSVSTDTNLVNLAKALKLYSNAANEYYE